MANNIQTPPHMQRPRGRTPCPKLPPPPRNSIQLLNVQDQWHALQSCQQTMRQDLCWYYLLLRWVAVRPCLVAG
eukprot:scaffold3077_cov162-Amphora_coffeaeformis.AAC.24